MTIRFGSVHALSTTVSFAIHDVCLHPEYVEPQSKEVRGPEYSHFEKELRSDFSNLPGSHQSSPVRMSHCCVNGPFRCTLPTYLSFLPSCFFPLKKKKYDVFIHTILDQMNIFLPSLPSPSNLSVPSEPKPSNPLTLHPLRRHKSQCQGLDFHPSASGEHYLSSPTRFRVAAPLRRSKKLLQPSKSSGKESPTLPANATPLPRIHGFKSQSMWPCS